MNTLYHPPPLPPTTHTGTQIPLLFPRTHRILVFYLHFAQKVQRITTHLANTACNINFVSWQGMSPNLLTLALSTSRILKNTYKKTQTKPPLCTGWDVFGSSNCGREETFWAKTDDPSLFWLLTTFACRVMLKCTTYRVNSYRKEKKNVNVQFLHTWLPVECSPSEAPDIPSKKKKRAIKKKRSRVERAAQYSSSKQHAHL